MAHTIHTYIHRSLRAEDDDNDELLQTGCQVLQAAAAVVGAAERVDCQNIRICINLNDSKERALARLQYLLMVYLKWFHFVDKLHYI